MRFLDHTRRTTVDGTPLDEWSARRRDLYLTTTHNTHNRQTSMPPVGFEPTFPAGERPQTYALDRAATGTGQSQINKQKTNLSNWKQTTSPRSPIPTSDHRCIRKILARQAARYAEITRSRLNFEVPKPNSFTYPGVCVAPRGIEAAVFPSGRPTNLQTTSRRETPKQSNRLWLPHLQRKLG